MIRGRRSDVKDFALIRPLKLLLSGCSILKETTVAKTKLAMRGGGHIGEFILFGID